MEALGAGAGHASTKAEKQDQIARDVPRISYKVLDKVYGCAMGEFMEKNIQEKLVSLQYLPFWVLRWKRRKGRERQRQRQREGEGERGRGIERERERQRSQR